MKHTSSHKSLAAAFSAAALVSCALGADAVEPPVPQATFTVTPSSVPSAPTEAWSPKLNWNITYPQVVKEIVTVDDGGELTPKKNLKMDIRVIGAQIQSGDWLKVQGNYRINTGSWTTIWEGKHSNLGPQPVAQNLSVSANQKLSFRARCANTTSNSPSSNQWQSWYEVGTSQKNVRALVNGDSPPDYAPAYSQGSVKGCLQPYLDSAGKIKIGPMDVILIWELWGSDTHQTYFDMQDFVILGHLQGNDLISSGVVSLRTMFDPR